MEIMDGQMILCFILFYFCFTRFLKWNGLRFFNAITVLARPILSWTKVA